MPFLITDLDNGPIASRENIDINIPTESDNKAISGPIKRLLSPLMIKQRLDAYGS